MTPLSLQPFDASLLLGALLYAAGVCVVTEGLMRVRWVVFVLLWSLLTVRREPGLDAALLCGALLVSEVLYRVASGDRK